MIEATSKYAQRLAALKTDRSIDDASRTARALDLVWEATANLQDNVGELMNGLMRQDRWAFGALAAAIERTHAGSGREIAANGDPSHAPLFLVPVIFMHSPGAVIPRQLGLPLPPLPDGRPVPGLVDFLLSWEELTQRFSATQSLRSTLLQVREGLAVADARAMLGKVFGAASPRSVMNEYDSDQGRSYSLRFLPAYCLPGDAPWFATFEARSEWQQRAFSAMQLASPTDMLPHPQAPAPYSIALTIAESFVAESAMRLVVEDAARARAGAVAAGQASVALLLEPFGAPETGVASHFRISAVAPGNVARPYASASIRIPIAREWAFWEDTATRFAESAKERLGIDATVASIVQDLDLLFPELGETRLHVLLGPPVGSAPPALDGIPFDVAIAGDDQRKWADHERGQAGALLTGFSEVLAANLQLEVPPRSGRMSFALLEGVWRPVMTIDLGRCRTSSGKRLHRPLDKAALENAKATWSPRAARAWILVAEAGSSSG